MHPSVLFFHAFVCRPRVFHEAAPLDWTRGLRLTRRARVRFVTVDGWHVENQLVRQSRGVNWLSCGGVVMSMAMAMLMLMLVSVLNE